MNLRTYSFLNSFHSPEHPPFEFPVEILGAGHESRNQSSYRWNNARHASHPLYLFQYTKKGRGFFSWSAGGERRTVPVGSGTMFLASDLIEYEYWFEGPGDWEFQWIMLRGRFAHEVSQKLLVPQPLLHLAPEAPAVLLLDDFLRRLEARELDRYSLSVTAYEFLARLLKQHEENPVLVNEVLQISRALVLRSLATITPSDLAQRFGYNERYFIEYFRRRVGVTPHRFIVRQKLLYAASLLSGTEKKIGAIAEELGFAEDNYFSRVFRRHLGLTPEAYRKINRVSLTHDEIILV